MDNPLYHQEAWKSILEPERLVLYLHSYGAYITYLGTSREDKDTIVMKVSVPQYIINPIKDNEKDGMIVLSQNLNLYMAEMSRKTEKRYEINYHILVGKTHKMNVI